MDITKFNKLLMSGFDMEFTYNGVFYSITKGKLNHKEVFSIADNKGWYVCLNSVEEVVNYDINDKKMKDIIESVAEEEFCY